MCHTIKQARLVGGCGRELCAKRLGSCAPAYGVKNKAKHQTECMSYDCSQNKTVCEVPSLCVPVTGIMESAVSWHIQRQSQAPVVLGGFGGSVLRPGNRVNIQLYFLDNLPISLAVRTPFSMPLADTS